MTNSLSKNPGGALHALTAAALLLPGLSTPISAAEPGTLNLQFSRYEEGARDLPGVDSQMPALQADSLHLSGAALLRERIRATFSLTQDTWSGATPVAVAPAAANGNRPVLKNSAQGVVVAGASPIVNGRLPLTSARTPAGDARATLIMSSASPELRQQADVGFEVPLEDTWRDTTLTFGAGISDEPDYRSRYGRIGARFAFNDNLTTLSAGTSITRSDTRALLDSDLLPYLTRNAYAAQLERRDNSELLRGDRRDRNVDIGITQVIDAQSVFDAGLALNRASGFLETPYKAVTVIFADPAVPASGDVRALIEQRPDERRQLTMRAHYARHFAAAGATLQLDYAHSRDDWNIDSHSVEFGWAQALGAWTLTPRLRYYTQTAADFHAPWLVTPQSYRTITIDAAGEPQVTPYSAALLPAHFSSDHRLAAFGSLSAGLTLQRPFASGLTFEAGFEYYRRADGLYAGAAANGAYADFDFALANVALTVDLNAAARRERRAQSQAHLNHGTHDSHVTPAGLMFAHGAAARGTFMTAYRASHLRQHGALLDGSRASGDAAVVNAGCVPARCSLAPAGMTMTMHMLDLMYAVTDSVAVMVMPQYMTMDMQLRALAGGAPPTPGTHNHGSAAHASGAVGDTLIAGLFNLHAQLTATLAVSVPTGKTDLEYRRTFQNDGGLMHYDMQTGSGTWDLLPALTWNGTRGAWHHGAQISGIKRLEDRNDSGYRLGDQLQITGWTSRALNAHLSASLRAVWQHRGAIDGAFGAYNAAGGPMDFPGNYGGDFVNIGLGVSLAFAGSQLAVEWLAPVHENVNGFQLERQGTLSAGWHYNY